LGTAADYELTLRLLLKYGVSTAYIPEVLVHEVGHAVSYFNLEFKEFMEFVKAAGYNMTEFRKFFIPGNKFHQIGLKAVDINKESWEGVIDRFSMKSLAHNMDLFGEIVLKLKREKCHPMYENPLEAFAWTYEWYFNHNPEFRKMALSAAKRGDRSFFEKYSFEQGGVQIDKTVKYFLGISSDKNVIPQEIEIGNYAWLEFNEALEKITFAEGKKMLIEVGTHLDRIKEL